MLLQTLSLVRLCVQVNFPQPFTPPGDTPFNILLSTHTSGTAPGKRSSSAGEAPLTQKLEKYLFTDTPHVSGALRHRQFPG